MFGTFLLSLATVRGAVVSSPVRSTLARNVVLRSARSMTPVMAEQVVVTDGSDSFFNSRGVFQSLYDHGDYDKITALSTSIAEAKKMLISRQARYSGLIDVLTFSEDAAPTGMAGASVWVAINAKPSQLPSQIAAAKAAGIKRAFVHVCSAEPQSASIDMGALEKSLAASGMVYSLLRTGKLVDAGAGGGLKLGSVDESTTDELCKEDIFRFITEAITIEDAFSRSFSLSPSSDDSQLREMRFAGCTRREEVEALLKGKIKEKVEEEVAAPVVSQEEESKSKAEQEASREEELKMLLQRAKEKGIENQKKRKEEEAAKQAAREQRATYFKSPTPDDGKGSGDGEEV